MRHVLHIEEEGFEPSGTVGTPYWRVRPYCECGWLGERAIRLDPPNAKQDARNQFYIHLEER